MREQRTAEGREAGSCPPASPPTRLYGPYWHPARTPLRHRRHR
ncbi:hypothetical protein ACQ4WX_46365 [Streptomyces lasalocidi]